MKQNRYRNCHKCAEGYDYVDFANYVIGLSGFLKCRYCGYYNRIRPKAKTWGRKAFYALVFLLTFFVVLTCGRYIFFETLKSAPIFSDIEAYKNTEHYALRSQIYENKTAIGLAGLYLFFLIGLPAFVLSRWCLNIISYFSHSK